ncbi:MAG: hydrogenase nickel incorporation protein HypB [Pseudomonadota bacterium]
MRVEGDAGEHEHEHVLADGSRVRHRHTADAGAHAHGHAHEHDHDHGHGHGHGHEHGHVHGHGHADAHRHSHAAYHNDAPAELVALEAALLDKNQRIAERNRGWFAGRGVVALNLMSSPGSGKTTLLVRTLRDLAGEFPMCVVEGDQETSADADRIRETGAPAIQINTGAGCHLEADMLERAVQRLAPAAGSLLFVENVGNLVCPSLFDLGESARVVVLSVTEGDDKPLKYPHMFRRADLMITTKMDLAPHVAFDVARAERHARAVNPQIRCLRISSTRGDGLDQWYGWLRALRTIEAVARPAAA